MLKKTAILTEFCDLIGGVRAFKYSNPNELPIRAVFDEVETYETLSGGDLLVEMEIRVESVFLASDDEGAQMDAELTDIITSVFNADYQMSGKIDAINLIQSTYKYSEMGESVIGLSVQFKLKYQVNKFNPTI